jgi:hypothetical protein
MHATNSWWSGIPLRDAISILHSRNGRVEKYNGTIPFSSQQPGQCAAELKPIALNAAKLAIGASVYKWELPAEEAFRSKEQHDVTATFSEREIGIGRSKVVNTAFAGNLISMHINQCRDMRCS